MTVEDLAMAQEVLDVYPSQTIGHVIFDFQITLTCEDHDKVVFISEFAISGPDLAPMTVDPERPAEAAKPLVELRLRRISALTIEDNSTLAVEFDGGYHLKCPPDPDYEAWWVVQENGAMIICMPGGNLAVWGPRSES